MQVYFFSSRRRHTRSKRDWSSDVCSSDLKKDHKFMKKKLKQLEIDYTPYLELFELADDEKQKFSIFEQTEKVKIGRASCRERVKRREMKELYKRNRRERNTLKK